MAVPQTSTHPQSPREDGLVSRLRLLRSRRVGPATYRRLIAENGSAEAALRALPEVARKAGVADYTPCPPGVIEHELKAARAAGARLIGEDDPDWPAALTDLADAPPLLWCIGDTALFRRPAVALVGARNASSLGTRMAKRLAAALCEAGFTVVSGLARGIDAAAHDAALPATIAVQAGGVDVIYPAENAALADRIGAQGLRISEAPIGLQPQARHFPARNRIIAGLAQAVVVVEAAAKSGSLLTARNALDNHREVLAVPGHPFDARAAGCNMLIRDGAILVRSAEDVIEALGSPAPRADTRAPELPLVAAAPASPAPPRPLREVAKLHDLILARLGPAPLAEDQLIRDLAVPPGQVAPALVDLELDGRIARQAGGLLSRIDG